MLTSTAPVFSPKTLDEALAFRRDHPNAMPLAGGTDLMVGIELGAVKPEQILNLWQLSALRSVRTNADGGVAIGALCTYRHICRHDAVIAAAPTLVEASRTVGAQQIQNRGTLAGNIANASPAGDTLPVLLSLDAVIEVESAARGPRQIPMNELYTGYRQLSLAPDELITWIHLPSRHSNDRTHFRKVGTRLAQAISKVMLAVRVRMNGDLVEEARVALGSVGPIPLRAASVEDALVGSPIDPSVAELLANDITPIDDIRSTREYRIAVAKRTLNACLTHLARS